MITKISDFISRKIIKEESEYYKKHYENNMLLYPGDNADEKTRTYFNEKIKLCIYALIVGGIFMLALAFNKEDESVDRKLKRNAKGEDAYEVMLKAEVGDEQSIDMKIKVEPSKYTYDEFINMMPKLCEKIDELILSDNESLDRVDSNLNLPSRIEGYSFDIKWESSDSRIVDEAGNVWQGNFEDVKKEKSEEKSDSNIVNLTAHIKYEEYEYLYEFGVVVYPKKVSEKERIKCEIEKAIGENNEKSKETDYLNLPDSVDGIKVVWKKNIDDYTGMIAILVVVVIVGIFIGKDKDVNKKLNERNEQLMEDYPEIVSKLAMLIGAGMTVRGAFKRIASENKKRYAYEEMKYAVNEMESGTLESVCYRHFCGRVKLQKYVKLISLLEQNSRMGSRGLIADLKNESQDAFEDKKSNAEKKGEEAGTKLLLPMFMQLFIVMVVIMVPAFMGM